MCEFLQTQTTRHTDYGIPALYIQTEATTLYSSYITLNSSPVCICGSLWIHV